MPSLVLGTAGHIDHGKSSLVKAMTGVDPDRLPEEKQRGVTIELGFARLELPSGRSMGVVDVPGHERFVRQMVAGATGIDVVLLVVAADDGVMPQTREHLAIVDLLGIPAGVVALTKSDLVEPDWLELVADDVRTLLEGTTIAEAPIVPVSAKTGRGLPELLTALDEVAGEAESRQSRSPFRLPVDRVFTISGAGTVVTGTLWSGRVSRDDPVELLPAGARGRVRSVQVHSEPVDEAAAGQRVALNLAGVEREDVQRGDIAAEPGTLTVTDRFDAWVTYLPSEEKTFESGTRVHVHHGTREVLGRILLMDSEELAPGGSGLAQVRLEQPLAPRYDDRFIIRSYSPMWTIGGGVVLDVLPARRTSLKPRERELLEALLAHDLSSAAVGLLASRAMPMSSAEVAAALGVPRGDVADELNRAELGRLRVGGETYFVTPEALEELVGAVERELLAFHDREPKETGIAVAALRDRVERRMEAKVFDALLQETARRGIAAVEKGQARHPAAAVSALAEEQAAEEALMPVLREQWLSPGTVGELASAAGVDPRVARKVLTRLVNQGRIVRVGPELHFVPQAVEEFERKVVGLLGKQEAMTAAEARDVTGSSRKYVVPLLEYLDAKGVTKREGDVRTLRKR